MNDSRLLLADALEAEVREIAEALLHAGRLHANFEDQGLDVAAIETRSWMSLLRMVAADKIDHARRLRTGARDEPAPEPPRALTVRRIR